MMGQSASFATNPLCDEPGDQKEGSVEAITVAAAMAGRKPARIIRAQIVGPIAAHGSKAHCRADCDDERAVRHRLVELLEGCNRVERQQAHDEARGKKHKARFPALQKPVYGHADYGERRPHFPCHEFRLLVV